MEITTIVLVDTTGTELAEMPATTTMSMPIHSSLSTTHTAHIPSPDNDSLTNLIQSQTTMFTQAIHQMDDLAKWQAKFKHNTQSALDTIMQQLVELTWNTCKQEYHNDKHQDYLTANNSMEEDVGDT